MRRIDRLLYKPEPPDYNRDALSPHHSFRHLRLALLPVLGLVCVVLGLPNAGCTRRNDAPASAPAPAPAPPGGAAKAPTGTAAPAALPDVPGLDLRSLLPAAQAQLAHVLSDEFCYCGCPHTLGACLQEHPTCAHAKRMTQLAARQVAAGASGVETIVLLSGYYGSFRDKRATFTVDDAMCMGPKDAKVTMVEFSDFECPYCATARPILKGFAERNAERVRFCFAPFPLPMHPNAIPATQATLAARQAGKFWQMHDALFENQAGLSVAKIRELAKGLGIGAEVSKALDSKAFSEEIARWKEQGRMAGVTGTPSLFFNGRRFTLPLNDANLSRALEDELEWAAHNGWAKD